MKKIIIHSLIAASIAFNIAFTVSVILRPKPFDRPEPQLRKNKELRGFFRREQFAGFHEDVLKAKKEFFEYLRSEDFDKDIAYKKIEKIIERQQIMEYKVGNRFIEYRLKYGADKCMHMFRNNVRSQKNHRKHNRGEKK